MGFAASRGVFPPSCRDSVDRERREGLDLGLDRNGIGLKREEAVIVGAGARHLIWHSRRKIRVVVCAPFRKR